MNTATKTLIGKGAFTKAYRLENGRVWLDTVDPIKEIMGLGWFPECYLFPVIERADEGYIMDYYERKRGLKDRLTPRQWRLYKALRFVFDEVSFSDAQNCFYRLHEEIYAMPSEFEREKEYLHEAVDACGNAGSDVRFEISPRNVAVKNGKLILLDCFFIDSKLKESRGW